MMRILFVALPLACLLLGILFNHFYPLTKARMSDIRRELEARRGTVG
jgi:Na+/melibiose symporter-like transporter